MSRCRIIEYKTALFQVSAPSGWWRFLHSVNGCFHYLQHLSHLPFPVLKRHRENVALMGENSL
jgi:hypothetical protein